MKHMEVCIVCGAFLVVNDTQTRVDAHLSGKQHVGYKMIREAISELKVRSYHFLNIFLLPKSASLCVLGIDF